MSKTYSRWTEAETAWLTEYYPDHGIDESIKEYERIFNKPMPYKRLVRRVHYLRLHITNKRRAHVQHENGKNYCQKERRDVGFVNPDTGMIKTENGWMRLSKYLNIPKGYYAIHLNGDKTDNRPENIMVVSRRTCMKMTLNRFWSEHSDITKAGILCCDLEDALDQKLQAL